MGNPGEDCPYGKSRLMNRAQEDLKLKSMMAIKQFVQRLDPNVEVCFDSSQWFYREVLGVILAIGDREAHPLKRQWKNYWNVRTTSSTVSRIS